MEVLPDRRFLISGGLAAAMGATFGFPRDLRWLDADAFLASVGLNGHFGQAQTPYAKMFDRVMLMLSDLGVQRYREDLGFSFRKGRDADQFLKIRTAAALGFRFSLVCFDGVHAPVGIPTELTPRIYDWCDGAVDFFEGPNEPMVGRSPAGPALLKEYQQRLYEAVRASADLKDVRVLGPSLIQAQIRLAEPMADVVDDANIHPYPGHFNPETTTHASLQLHIDGARRVFGDRPVVITETGYHTALATRKQHLPVPEAIKTRYIPRLLLWCFHNGVKRTYLYEGVSSFDRGDTDPESSFGLLRNDLSPTPSYYAVKNLLAQFRPDGTRKYKGQPLSVRVERGPADLVCMGFRRRDGAKLVAVWRGSQGWDAHAKTLTPAERAPLNLRLRGRPRTVRLHRFRDDGCLSSTRLEAQNDLLRVSVDDSLAIVVLA